MELNWYMPDGLLWLPLAACLLDLLLGDPRALPHPVNLIGGLLSLLERPLLAARRYRKIGGCIALLAALAVTCGAAALALNLPELIFSGRTALFLKGAATLYLCYTGLALGCLLREGRKARLAIDAVPDDLPDVPDVPTGDSAPVAASGSAMERGGLGRDSLQAARLEVSMLVSRDVSRLGKAELYRTLAESLSENFNDAFVAPFFWLLLGGPVGLWLYKCASTADSRWGYRHEPWERRGWAAARLDDLLAFVPARISAFLLYLTRPGRRGAWPGWAALQADAMQMESPNAGWSMSAAAWLHEAHMGGPAVYAGKRKDKPILGPAGTGWDSRKIIELLRHLRIAGVCGAFLLWSIWALAFWLGGTLAS